MARSVTVAAYRRLSAALVLLAVALTTWALYAALHTRWFEVLLALPAGVLLLYAVQRLAIRTDAGAADLLIFATKDECALCDEARLLLGRLTTGSAWNVKEVRIETDRFLRRHFKNEVPVLLWQGEVLARLAWDAGSLRGRLEALKPAASGGGPPSPIRPAV